MHEWAHCCDEAAGPQLPTAEAFWLIWIVSSEECSSLMQNSMQTPCSAHSATWNAVTTQYTCSLKGIYYCPHWLVQWSHHCSGIGIPVHSPCLLGYIDVMQTILVILTMAGLFLESPHCTSSILPSAGDIVVVKLIKFAILMEPTFLWGVIDNKPEDFEQLNDMLTT